MTFSPSSRWLAAVDVKELRSFFAQFSGTDLPLSVASRLADDLKLPLAAVEKAALEHSVTPTRYLRNCLSCEEQLKLLSAHITIIGCGGLGGAVSMQLARTGIGRMHLVDPDTFEEHNLNRQNFCTVSTIGQPKADAAAKGLTALNPALTCTTSQTGFSEDDLLEGIIIDCLDDVEPRRELAALCRKHHRLLVHGAVAGWYGRVGTVTAENRLFDILYQNRSTEPSATPPKVLAPTVYQIASLQVAETLKHLLGYQQTTLHSWLDCDLKNSRFENIDYSDR